MTLALVLTIVVALLTRPGRAVAIRTHRLVGIVPVLDGVRALALIAIPVLGALILAEYRTSEAQTVGVSGRSVPSTSAKRGTASPPSSGQEVRGLPNTGPDVGTASEAAFPSIEPGGTPTVCRNSTDPICGPFRWDPPPGPNSPIEILITYSPIVPRVGEAVTITAHVHDDDARIGDVTMTFGDEDVITIPPASIVGCGAAPPAGPWSPPAPSQGDLVKTFRHTYSAAGDRTLAVYAASPEFLNPTCPPNPYASQATASHPIHINEG